ncbi:transposase [Actinopolymorpha alba]|uniref:transposase n=3 Tax=Actinopolymorpha alba TaxID=533267 RepID=UPI0003689F8E|nr:transposase [Actinopolymorpha alba]
MSNKPRKYSPELRAEVVAYVLDADHTPAQAARDFGLVAETVRNWVKAEKEQRLGNTEETREAGGRARISELERRVRELSRKMPS